MSSETRITTISIISPPDTCDSPGISEPLPTDRNLQHTLVIDLRDADSNRNSNDITPIITGASRTYSIFLHRLRSIVQQDGRDNPRFDTVRLHLSLELPDERTWKVLEGLRPRHFEVKCNWDEEYDFFTLEYLKWPLESLTIVGACGRWDVPSIVVQYIPSLTLNYCCGLFFTPATDHSALRHLTIMENDAFAMFVDLMKKFSVTNLLETLKLRNASYSNYDMRPAGFAEVLEQCTSLLSLDLATCIRWRGDEISNIEYPDDDYLEDEGSENESYGGESSGDEDSGDEDSGDEGSEGDDSGDVSSEDEQVELLALLAGLPHHFPDNVEHLRFSFSGPPKMTTDLSELWLKCAVNPSWVPNLKTLSFKLDIGTTPGVATSTEPQVEKFLSLLSEYRPAVQIIR